MVQRYYYQGTADQGGGGGHINHRMHSLIDQTQFFAFMNGIHIEWKTHKYGKEVNNSRRWGHFHYHIFFVLTGYHVG